MARLAQTTRVGKTSSGWIMSEQVTYFQTTSGSPNYLHFKTNLSASSETIFMAEAEGYNYGLALPILCAWGVYTASGTVASKGLASATLGLEAHGIYKSSDGYVVLRAYAGSHYYTGFGLNFYSSTTFTITTPSISGITQTSESGNYY